MRNFAAQIMQSDSFADVTLVLVAKLLNAGNEKKKKKIIFRDA